MRTELSPVHCTANRSNLVVPNKIMCTVNWASVYLTDHDATEHICCSNEFSKWLLDFNCEYLKFQLCYLSEIGWISHMVLVVTEWAYILLGLVVTKVDFKAAYPQILMYAALKCICYAKCCQVIYLLEYSSTSA